MNNQTSNLKTSAPKPKKMMKGEKKTNPEKQALIERSQKAKSIKQKMIDKAKTMDEKLAAEAMTINSILLAMYEKETGCGNFKSFKEWRENGYSVKKGEKAFRVWSAPRKGSKEVEAKNLKTGEATTIEDQYRFWGMCCLFNSNQVELITEEKSA